MVSFVSNNPVSFGHEAPEVVVVSRASSPALEPRDVVFDVNSDVGSALACLIAHVFGEHVHGHDDYDDDGAMRGRRAVYPDPWRSCSPPLPCQCFTRLRPSLDVPAGEAGGCLCPSRMRWSVCRRRRWKVFGLCFFRRDDCVSLRCSSRS